MLWQDVGIANIEKLEQAFPGLFAAIEEKDKNAVAIQQQDLLAYVGNIEEAMVNGFPFEVPPEYEYLPRLKVHINKMMP